MTKEEVLDTLYILQNTMAMLKEPLTNDQVIKLIGDIAKTVAKIPDDNKEEKPQKKHEVGTAEVIKNPVYWLETTK